MYDNFSIGFIYVLYMMSTSTLDFHEAYLTISVISSGTFFFLLFRFQFDHDLLSSCCDPVDLLTH